MICNELFNESLEKHQRLVSQIAKNIDKGISFTKAGLARKLNMSYTNVCKCIKRLNVEDECITYDKNGMRLNYTDLTKRGVFSKIIEMMIITEKIPILIRLKNEDLCNLFQVKETTVQMYRAYILDKNENYDTTFRLDKALKESIKNAPKELAEKLEEIISNTLIV